MINIQKDYTKSFREFYTKERLRMWNSRYVPTLIPGLDKLLRGGLILPHNKGSKDIENIVILIKGQAGTGKTTLATQIMLGIYYYLENVQDTSTMLSGKKCIREENEFIGWKESIKARQTKFMRLNELHSYPVVYSCEQTGEEFQTYLKRFIGNLDFSRKVDVSAYTDIIKPNDRKFKLPNPKMIVTRTLKVRKPKSEFKKDKENIAKYLTDIIGKLLERLKSVKIVIAQNQDFYNKHTFLTEKLIPTLKIIKSAFEDKIRAKDLTLETDPNWESLVKKLISFRDELKNSKNGDTLDPFLTGKLISAKKFTLKYIQEDSLGNALIDSFNETIKNLKKKRDELLSGYIKCMEAKQDLELIKHWILRTLPPMLENGQIDLLEIKEEIEKTDNNDLEKILGNISNYINNYNVSDSSDEPLKILQKIDRWITKYFNDYFGGLDKADSDDANKKYEIEETTRSFSAWKDDLENFLYTDSSKENLCPVVLVDGLNSFSEQIRRNLDTQKIIRKLRERALFSIIVYEDDKQHFENLDYLADVVFQLKGEEIPRTPNYYINNLMIEKSRFQQSVLGWHQYKLRINGLEVFPSLHFRTHRLDKLTEFYQLSQENLEQITKKEAKQDNDTNNDEVCTNCLSIYRTSCATCANFKDPKGVSDQLKTEMVREITKEKEVEEPENFLEYILQTKIKYGSSIAVLGPRHTFKLQSTLDFLRSGSRNGEAGLIISLLDSDRTLEKDRKSLCKWLCNNPGVCSECYDHVYALHLRPGCITPEEFMALLERRLIDGAIAGEPIRRILFWDLVHLESRFPFFVDDPLFLPALVDYLRYHWAITVVFVGPSNSKMAYHVASLVSNLIFTWRDSLKNPNDNDNKDWNNAYKKITKPVEAGNDTVSPTEPIEGKVKDNNIRNDFYSFYSSAIEGNPSESSFMFFLRGNFDACENKRGYHKLAGSIKSIQNSVLNPQGEDKEKVDIDKLSKTPEWYENALSMRKRIWELQGLRGAIDIESILKLR
jgi:hypothetical protein